MEVSWTKEQRQVIELQGRSLLVSAAAGSGKTAVLVQRIIERICDRKHPVDIDRLLVVTFTNAAAGEMRERVGRAIEKRLEAEPDNVHLKRQEVLLSHARITTIDSFCLSVLREHFQEIRLDPSFRIGDEGELRLLREDVLRKLLEEEYREGSESFIHFMEAYAPGRDDERAARLILQLYEFSMANPRPQEWLEHCLDSYVPLCGQEKDTGEFESLEAQPWMQDMLGDLRMMLQEQAGTYNRILAICREEDGPECYTGMLLQEQEAMYEACRAQGYEALRLAVRQIVFGSRPRRRKTDTYSDEKAKRAWEMRERVKQFVKKLQEEYLADDPRRIAQKQRLAGNQVRELVRLTRSFIVRYSAQKRRKNLVDFSDLEHMALEVLSRQTPKGEEPTETAAQYRDSFEEIMIDEYQDSNYVQELILTSIARTDPPNLFMVGDVKQSIYRFRLARPELFMEKYASYTTEESTRQKIELHQNFRSRASVLEGVNFFFYQLMQKCVGRVDYDREAALYPGRVYEPCEGHPAGGDTELLLLDLEDVPEEPEEDSGEDKPDMLSYSSREWEAALIAGRIRELTDPQTGAWVWDGEAKSYRLAEYRDIAILLRTVSGWAEEFIPVLLSQGIPAVADTGSGYFSAIEVQTALSLLEIIDNPLQDIPLAAVLHSAIGGFDSQELAVVRAEEADEGRPQSRRFYEAMESYVARHSDDALAKKLSGFLHRLEGYREKSRYLSLHELLDYVLRDSGYYDYVCAMPGASGRKANLDMLLARAQAFEKTSYQGVFQFVRYVNRLKKYSVDYAPARGDSGQNQVRIMSIHKSKGLEFPVCIVAGLGKSFNRRDTSSSILFSVDYGIGTDAIDPVRRTREQTVMKQAIRSRSLLENLGEELRVLYVAMTRAKEKLILTGARGHMAEYLQQCIYETDPGQQRLPYCALTGAGSLLDWIVEAAAKHRSFAGIYERLGIPVPYAGICFNDGCGLSVSVCTKSALAAGKAVRRVEDTVKRRLLEQWPCRVYDEADAAVIRERFEADYAYDGLSGIHAAFTVSQLKREEGYHPQEEPAAELYVDEEEERLPGFLREDRPAAGAARGTLYHWLFEHLDFAKGEFGRQLDTLVREGKISPQERSRIRREDFAVFAAGSLGKRVAKAQACGRYHREESFILGIRAAEMERLLRGRDDGAGQRADFARGREEYVSIQGVMDAWLEEDDGLVLIDFKTDRLPGDNPEEVLRRRYQGQLWYYRRALEQMTGKKVKEIYLYSTALGREIPLEINVTQ